MASLNSCNSEQGVNLKKRLAIYLNTPFFYDGLAYSVNERFVQFWSSFTSDFERVVFCVPVLCTNKKKGLFPFETNSNRIEIVHLPYYESPIDLYRRLPVLLPRAWNTVLLNMHKWDIIGALVPNIIGLAIIMQAKAYSKPCFNYIRGSEKGNAYQFGGLKKYVALGISAILEAILKKVAGRTLTLVVGNELYKDYKRRGRPVHRIIVSLISENDILVQSACQQVCHKQDLRLLYVGRLSGEKGVAILIDAMHILTKRNGIGAKLTIIGAGEEEDSLRAKVRQLALGNCVNFMGHIPYGEDVLRLFKESEIFVLPSLTEGFPKTLLEAMANCTPIIATSVGGIPELVKNGFSGILAPPGDASGLANAIRRLHSNKELRVRLAENGRMIVRGYTMEKQRANIVNLIRSYCM